MHGPGKGLAGSISIDSRIADSVDPYGLDESDLRSLNGVTFISVDISVALQRILALVRR